jgi:hypothetical protein
VDADQVIALAQTLAQEKELQHQVANAAEEERQRLTRALRTIQKQVAVLQANVLTTYNSDYVRCRDMGHSWEIDSISLEGNEMTRHLLCARCDTKRYENVARTGDLLARSYKHSSEYLLPHAVTSQVRFTKAFWRGISYMQSAS